MTRSGFSPVSGVWTYCQDAQCFECGIESTAFKALRNQTAFRTHWCSVGTPAPLKVNKDTTKTKQATKKQGSNKTGKRTGKGWSSGKTPRGSMGTGNKNLTAYDQAERDVYSKKVSTVVSDHKHRPVLRRDMLAVSCG